MVATATPIHERTVRLRPGDLPVRPARIDAKTTRIARPLPKAISAFDGKTVRLRPINIGTVARTVRQRYVDLAAIQARPPTKWDIARVLLVLALASMPILGISVDVFGLVPQHVTSVVLIALCAVLGAIITFAPHRIDMIVGRGLIAGMVACISTTGGPACSRCTCWT